MRLLLFFIIYRLQVQSDIWDVTLNGTEKATPGNREAAFSLALRILIDRSL
jgi:hypothetical protein